MSCDGDCVDDSYGFVTCSTSENNIVIADECGGDISCCDSDTDWNLEKVENHVQYYNDRGEDTEPRLDLTLEDYLENGEEYAYVFTLDHEWVCYELPYQGNPIVRDIPLAVVTQ